MPLLFIRGEVQAIESAAVDVPEGWWKEACEVVNHPMACVATDNRFVWVNSAFERLTGYSRSELAQMMWMDITVQSDVGGDLASVKDVIDGIDHKYTIAKRYRHKLGKDIPIVLSVWRFPRSVDNMLACFIVEAIPQHATTIEVEKLRAELQEQINAISNSLAGDTDSKEINVSYNSQNANNGGSNSANSTTVVALVAAVSLAAIVAVGALVFGGILRINVEPGGGSVQVESQE